MATIRHTNAMRAEVRLRWSQEVIDGTKLIRGRMETEPGDNSSISFGQPRIEIAQTAFLKGPPAICCLTRREVSFDIDTGLLLRMLREYCRLQNSLEFIP